MKEVTILDGYIDEPSCLGVPPYLSPHARYIYGALLAGGVEENKIEYKTIDQVREDKDWFAKQAGRWIIVLGGTTVPGKYLGGRPLTLKEMRSLPEKLPESRLWLVGPVVEVGVNIEGFACRAEGAGIREIYTYLQPRQSFSFEMLREFALLGAKLLPLHPNYPYVMCEIETYRGCQRSRQCSFCSERYKTIKYSREPQDILAEIKALGEKGARYFRFGCQPDLFNYKKGSLQALAALYEGTHQAVPNLKVLHLDNINPTSIVGDKKKGRKLLQLVTKYNTAGDIASLGLESADWQVIAANNIGATPAQHLEAIEMINEIGGFRKKGLPALLPGLNLLHGLKGEREESYQLNYKYLRDIYERGLLLRRINIRQVVAYGGYSPVAVRQKLFKQFKAMINEEIDRPMMEKVFPAGLILEEVITEKHEGNLTFGRQMGTYPIRVGIAGILPLKEPKQVKVIDHGYRSLTALPYPFNINEADLKQLRFLPGIGEKRATALLLNKPYKSLADLVDIIGEEAVGGLIPYLDEF